MKPKNKRQKKILRRIRKSQNNVESYQDVENNNIDDDKPQEKKSWKEKEKEKILHERRKRRQKQRQYNNSSVHGKMQIILSSMLLGISKYIEELVVFFIATVTVLYLFFRLENRPTSSIFPFESTKFPFTFYNTKQGYSEQRNITTLDFETSENFMDPIFHKVPKQTAVNGSGSVDNKKMLDSMDQPDNATFADMNIFGSFFNSSCHGKMSDEINLLQIISYILLYGITQLNFVFAQIHDSFKMFVSNDSQSNKNTLSFLSYPLSIILIVVFYLFFRYSKDDFSKLFMPMIQQNKFDHLNNIFGVTEILNLFSVIFSGFFSLFKVIFTLSYVFFIPFAMVGLFKLMGHLSNTSSVLIAFILAMTFLINFAFFFMAFLKTLNNKEYTSFVNTTFQKVFDTVKNSFSAFIGYFNNTKSYFYDAFVINKTKMGILDTIFYALSLPIAIAFLPFVCIPFIFLFLAIIFSIIPFIASFYMSTKISFDTTVRGIFNIKKLYKGFASLFLLIFISFIISFYSSVLSGQSVSNNVIDIVQTIIQSVLFFITALLIVYFGRSAQINSTVVDEYVKETKKNMTERERSEMLNRVKVTNVEVVHNKSEINSELLVNSIINDGIVEVNERIEKMKEKEKQSTYMMMGVVALGLIIPIGTSILNNITVYKKFNP